MICDGFVWFLGSLFGPSKPLLAPNDVLTGFSTVVNKDLIKFNRASIGPQ